jgi:hypothetical protein
MGLEISKCYLLIALMTRFTTSTDTASATEVHILELSDLLAND